MIYIIGLILHLFGIHTDDPTGQGRGCVICGSQLDDDGNPIEEGEK